MAYKQNDLPPFFNGEEYKDVTTPCIGASDGGNYFRLPHNFYRALKILQQKHRRQVEENPKHSFLLDENFDDYDIDAAKALAGKMNSNNEVEFEDKELKTVFYSVKEYMERVRPHKIPLSKYLLDHFSQYDLLKAGDKARTPGSFRVLAGDIGDLPIQPCEISTELRHHYAEAINDVIAMYLVADYSFSGNLEEKSMQRMLLRFFLILLTDYAVRVHPNGQCHARDPLLIKLTLKHDPENMTKIINRLAGTFSTLIFAVDMEYLGEVIGRLPETSGIGAKIQAILDNNCAHVMKNLLSINHLGLYDGAYLSLKFIHNPKPGDSNYCACGGLGRSIRPSE